MAASPTKRSLDKWRKAGYSVAVVERYNAYAKKSFDLFGCIDILAIGNGETVAIQTTTYSNVSARVKKIQANANYPIMLASGWRVIVEGWHRKGYWYECRTVDLSSDPDTRSA